LIPFFLRRFPNGLQPLWGIEHKTSLVSGANLHHRPTYRTNSQKTKEIKRQDIALLKKGWVKKSLNPCSMPVLLVPKKDKSRRMNTMKWYARWIAWGHSIIIIKEGDERKSAFKTKFGLYEWLVMPLGLTNTPRTFMRLLNHVMRDCIWHFLVVYFDEILIFCRSLDEHVGHLRQVLIILKKHHVVVLCWVHVTFCNFLYVAIWWMSCMG